MKKLLLLVVVAGCSALQPKPVIITKTDTVTVTKEVAPPLPSGDTVTICLGNGMPVTVRVAGADTLIGEQRVRLRDVRPALDFPGSYLTAPKDTIVFEKRVFRKQGVAAPHQCDEFKEVGVYNGVSVFALVDAPNNLPNIFLPVRAGVFQLYAPDKAVKRR